LLQVADWLESGTPNPAKNGLKYWCQDETRIGLKTIERKKLNPIERVWQHIKQELSWEIYKNLDEIKEKVRAFIEDFSLTTIASITGWDYILSALATVA
jgi:hypothetical protein